MKRALLLAAAVLVMPLTSGCVRTAASIVTAPVRAAGKVVDWSTTSQSEADEKRGRAMRKRDEQLGKLNRSYQRNTRDCESGSQAACERARSDYEAIEDVRNEAI